jgi:hypothetical protein
VRCPPDDRFNHLAAGAAPARFPSCFARQPLGCVRAA